MSRSVPPGPDGLPLLGNTLQYARDPIGFRERCVEEYGDVVYVRNAGKEVYMLSRPEFAREILLTDHDKYEKPDLLQKRVASAFGNGLLFSDGDLWDRQRRLLQPAFHPQQLQRYTEMMVEYSERLVDSWEPGEAYVVQDQMESVALKILVRSLFGVDVGERDRIARSVHDLLARFQPSKQLLPEWVPTPTNRRYKKAIDHLEGVIYDIIEQRRAAEDIEGDDLLSILVQAAEDDGVEMSNKTLRDEMVTFLMAGHESSAVSLTYALDLLTRNPDKEQAMLDELDEVIDGTAPTFEELRQLEYTENVVKEALRMYPPVFSIPRQPLETVEVDGYEVPEGSIFSINVWGIHHDERWYDDPWTFRPERFEDGDHPEFAYLPFGGGPRQCIGNRFSMMESQVILATIVQQYELEHVDDSPLDLEASLTVQPEDGLPMVVQER
ncbi:cytochrome P450 [Halobacteriales archaeon QS_1_68_20]|nr:MAG: cytochrome P450 [Halobacteriales archaeon QS_1_68_20]